MTLNKSRSSLHSFSLSLSLSTNSSFSLTKPLSLCLLFSVAFFPFLLSDGWLTMHLIWIISTESMHFSLPRTKEMLESAKENQRRRRAERTQRLGKKWDRNFASKFFWTPAEWKGISLAGISCELRTLPRESSEFFGWMPATPPLSLTFSSVSGENFFLRCLQGLCWKYSRRIIRVSWAYNALSLDKKAP